MLPAITKHGEAMNAGAGVAAGSYDTYKGNLFFANRSEKVAYSLNGSYFTSDGYRENSDTNAKDLGFNLTSYVGDSLNINFSTGYHKDNTRLPGNLKDSDFSAGASRTDTTTPDDFSEAEDFYFKVGPEYYFQDDSLLKLDVSYRKKSATAFYTGTGWTWASDTEIVTKTVSPQVVLKNEAGSMPNSLTLGVDYTDAEEDIVNNSSFSGMAEFELKKENYGYYFHDELQVTKDLLVSGGYRHDEVKFSFIPGSTNELKMDADLFTLGTNYTFRNKSYAYLSYSRSFRYPVLDEMFSYSSNTVSTNIVPQKSDSYEIGMRHYFADDLYTHINFFRIDTNDEIFFNRVTYANENLDGKSRRDGVEASFYAEPHELVSLTGSYSYIDASIQGGQYKGSDVPNVPNHKATLGVTVFPLQGLSIALNGIYTGKRPFNSDFENSLGDQEDYLVINSKIKYQWKNITTFLDLNNLTDKEYSEFAGKSGSQKAFYPSPGFNALVGVSVEI
jgi:iron complex outermembrane receptor protein